MGWTSYHATHYRRGQIDRKAECDSYFLEGLNTGYYAVLKSAMVGSVYYAAVMNLKRYGKEKPDGTRSVEDIPEAERRIWGVVFLTAVDRNEYFNFSYKDISEDMGPCESKCPVSILKLLSPTDSEWANEWRARCQEYAEKQKSPNALRNLPIGAVIRYKTGGGVTVELEKHKPA